MLNKPLVNVYTEGSLGKYLGNIHWKFAVSNPCEALRAININTKGKLNEYLIGKGKNKYYKIIRKTGSFYRNITHY